MATLRRAGTHWIADLRSLGGGQLKRKTKLEAEAELARAIAAKQAGTFLSAARAPSFGAVADRWAARQEARAQHGEIGVVHARSCRRLAAQLSAMPFGGSTLADAKACDITAGQLDLQVMPAITRGRSWKSASHLLTALGQIFLHGVKEGALAASPATPLRMPPRPARSESDIKRVSREMVDAIIAHAPSQDAALRIRFAASTGLRSGEMAALRWCDIDFDSGKISVRRARKRDGSIGAPKTRNGTRVVPLVPILRDELKAWKLRQPHAQRVADLVFPTAEGGVVDYNAWRKHDLRPACAAAGVEALGWHDLRHYFAAVLCFNSQISDHVISQVMGHASTDFTRQVYAAYFADRQRDATVNEQLSRALGGA